MIAKQIDSSRKLYASLHLCAGHDNGLEVLYCLGADDFFYLSSFFVILGLHVLQQHWWESCMEGFQSPRKVDSHPTAHRFLDNACLSFPNVLFSLRPI